MGGTEKVMRDTKLIPPNNLQSPDESENVQSPERAASLCQSWRWREMITAAFIVVDYFLLYSSISLIGVFFPAEANRKGASVFVTGVIVGISSLVVTVVAPIIGYLITITYEMLPLLKIPFTIVIGLVLVGTVYIGLGLSIHLPFGWPFIVVCIILRIIEGVATALFTTAGYTLLTELYPDSTGFIVGMAEVGAGVGYSSGPVIGGLLYKAGGYRLPFFVVGGLCFLLAIPISLINLILKSSRGKSERQLLRLKTVFNLLKNFVILLLVFSVILQLGGLGFINTAYSLFLKEQLGLTPEKIALVFLAISVPHAVLAPLTGKLADKTNPRLLVICGLCLSGFGYLLVGPTSLLPVKPILWLTICSQLMVGVSAGTTLVSAYTDVSIIVLSQSPSSDSEQKKLMGIIAGMISAAMSFGEFLGPIVGGGLTDLTCFRASSSVIGEVTLALMMLLLMVTLVDHCLDKRSKQDHPECKLNANCTKFDGDKIK